MGINGILEFCLNYFLISIKYSRIIGILGIKGILFGFTRFLFKISLE